MTTILNTSTTFFATLRRALLIAAVVSGALAATGCATATGQAFKAVADAPAGKGQVYLYRKSALAAGGSSFTVTVNKKEVGELFNGSFMQLTLTPGAHVFTVKPGATGKVYEQAVTIVENQTQFFEFELPPVMVANLFMLGSNITTRTAEQAKVDLKELKAVK